MKIIFFLFLVLISTGIHAQVYSISDGNVSSCNGVIHDTGGAGGPGYSNNESFTLTVCSDDPLQELVLNMQNLLLDPTNTDMMGGNNADVISVYDGNAVVGNPVYQAQGINVNGLLIVPSPNNTSGCLTIVFTSNDVGTGSFIITANCEYPCRPPFAAATTIPDTIARICKGDVVNFDASTSFAQPGFNLDKYYWDYDEGADKDSLSGVSSSYTFNTEGAYRVSLQVKDDNPDVRCFNTNSVEMVVLVAPDPVFEPVTVGGPVCLGESIVVDAFPDQYAQAWTGAPYGNFGSAQYIPDQVGSCFTSTLNFGAFDPGQQLNSINDLIGISMNFEHSYMGDLQVSIICPTGQSVLMHNQGGAGTYLGNPIDDETSGPGTGFDYTWSPTATNGTWVDNSVGNTTLPAGTYESESPLNGLVGCDMNGTWQIEICDLLGSDDGYIFSWGLDFDPSLYPGISYFKPIIGVQSDSSFWSPAPNAVISGDGNSITATPTSAGSYSYSYNVIDNHGCTNDTSVTVEITPNPITTASPDATICPNAPFQLGASVSPNPGAVVYTWSPAAGLSDPNVSNPTASITADVTYTVQAYKAGHPLCFTEDQVTLTMDPIPLAGADNAVDYCQSDPAVDINTLLDGTASTGGIWFDSNGNTPATMFDPSTELTDTLIYVTGDASIGCSDTAYIAIQVAVPFILNQSNDTTICENGTAVLAVSPTGGLGAPYTETWDQGLVGNGAHNVNPLVNTCYDVFVSDVNGCISQTETVCVNLNPPLQLTNSGNTTICINTNTVLDAVSVSGGNDGPYNYEWSDGISIIATSSQTTVSPTELTQYCLTITDNCESTPVTECLEVDLFDQPIATFEADKVDGCYPVQVEFDNQTDPGLVSSVVWSFGNGSSSTALGAVTTVYGAPICYDVKLTVTSPDGCIDDSLIESYICPFDYPTADFKMSPNPTTFFDTDIEFENLSSDDVTLNNWNFGTVATPPTSNLKNPTSRFPTETVGVYPVKLTVENAQGCQDTITRELTINSVFTLYVPNAFSPNNDGENETFYVQGESISTDDFLLTIFDRNGTIIFETTDINEHWLGTAKNGTPLKNGVYVWNLQAKDIYTNDLVKRSGFISIIK